MATLESEFQTCEHCGKDMVYPTERRGQVAACPYCNEQVVLGPTAPDSSAYYEPAPSTWWERRTGNEKQMLAFLGVVVGGILALALYNLASDAGEAKKLAANESQAEAAARKKALDERHAKAVEREERVQRGITVKGLYIGMSKEEARTAISKKFGPSWKVREQNPVVWFVLEDGLEGIRNAAAQDANQRHNPPPPEWRVSLAFLSGTLTEIKIGHKYSSFLFGSFDLSADEFAQTFVNAYHIPRLSPKGSYWEYVSPDSVRLRITTQKEVVIEQVADRSKVQQGFD